MVTAASELARNTLDYGGGGERAPRGARATGSGAACASSFEDQGPGIADIEQAMSDGYTTGGGLGLGLGGAKRLVDEFEIESKAGRGHAGDAHALEVDGE